jgi:hypothetical protein
MTQQHQPEVTVELYLRSLAPRSGRSSVENIVSRLRHLSDRGIISQYEVEVWGRQVPLDPDGPQTAPGKDIASRIEAFETWAIESDRSLTGIERKQVESSLSGESYSAIAPPGVLAAEYHDGDLAFVAPSTKDGECCSVLDRLTHLEDLAQDEPASTIGSNQHATPMAVKQRDREP